MKNNSRHLIRYWLVLSLIVTLVVILTACSSTSSPAASTPPQSTANAPTQSPTVPAPISSAPRQGAGTNGTIATISSDSLILNTQQGQVTVDLNSNTSIQKTVTGQLTDLQTSQFLTVIGVADASGNIAASSIVIRSQDQNLRFTPPSGTSSNTSARSNYPGGTNPRPNNGVSGNNSFNRAGNATFGTLAKIDGSTLTLTTGQGQQVTVTVGSNTTIQKTLNGTISDLQDGESLTVLGTHDTNGDITATFITIQTQD